MAQLTRLHYLNMAQNRPFLSFDKWLPAKVRHPVCDWHEVQSH